MERPLRIAFLNSWKPSAFDGSGTAVGISSLTLALRHLGHEVDLIQPSHGAGALPWRLTFNLKLPGLLRSRASYDLVVGFDLDGFRWASAADRRSPYIVCLKGIAADEARFSRSAYEHLRLSMLGWLERGNALGADRVLVPSQYLADVARERYHVSDDLLRVVPEAVDLRPWKEMQAAKRAVLSTAKTVGRPTILSVAHQYTLARIPKRSCARCRQSSKRIQTHSSLSLGRPRATTTEEAFQETGPGRSGHLPWFDQRG